MSQTILTSAGSTSTVDIGANDTGSVLVSDASSLSQTDNRSRNERPRGQDPWLMDRRAQTRLIAF